jgi:hypothetical protein
MQMFIVVRRRVSTGGQSGEHIRQTPMAGHLTKINRQEVLMNSSRRWNDAPRKSEGEEAGDADRGELDSSESENGGV